MKTILLALIRWYQRHGGSKRFFNTECNFEPSCSEYTHQAISQYGLLAGLKISWSRIRRCNDPDCAHKKYDPIGLPTTGQHPDARS